MGKTEEELQPLESNAKTRPDRLTIVGQVHHEHEGENPLSIPLNFSQFLTTTLEPYSRRLTIGCDWQPLIPATCWIQEPSRIIISNLVGTLPNPILPDEKTLAEEAKMVLEIAWKGSSVNTLRIVPKDTLVINPSNVHDMVIRSQSGQAVYRIYILAK